jgi:Fe-S oxidoreductase
VPKRLPPLGADVLATSANPGCAMQLAAAGLDVRHPADLLAEALDG